MAIAAGTDLLGPTGGVLFGVPVLTSAALGARVIALNPASLLVADEDGIEIDVSRQAPAELNDAPTLQGPLSQ